MGELGQVQHCCRVHFFFAFGCLFAVAVCNCRCRCLFISFAFCARLSQCLPWPPSAPKRAVALLVFFFHLACILGVFRQRGKYAFSTAVWHTDRKKGGPNFNRLAVYDMATRHSDRTTTAACVQNFNCNFVMYKRWSVRCSRIHEMAHVSLSVMSVWHKQITLLVRKHNQTKNVVHI